MTAVEQFKVPILPVCPIFDNLQAIGEHVGHPLLDMKTDTTTSSRYVEMTVCFTGIPACCLSGIGQGRSKVEAKENAAEKLLKLFEQVAPRETFQSVYFELEHKDRQSFMPKFMIIFEQFEKAVESNLYGISKCFAYKTAKDVGGFQGKQVRRRVMLNLRNPLTGYATKISDEAQQSEVKQNSTEKRSSDAFVMKVEECTAQSNSSIGTTSNSGEEEDESAPRKLMRLQESRFGVILNVELASLVDKFRHKIVERSTQSVKNISNKSWDFYMTEFQKEEDYHFLLRARKALSDSIKNIFPKSFLRLTGQTLDLCGAPDHMTEMCLCIPIKDHDGHYPESYDFDKKLSCETLERIQTEIVKTQKNCRLFPKNRFVSNKKNMIFELELEGEFDGLKVRITVNDIKGMYSTHLIHYYGQTDFRFPVMFRVIWRWAKVKKVLDDVDESDGFLNCHSLQLLVVHYLQCGMFPAVLPNLHHLFPSRFAEERSLKNLQFYAEIRERLPQQEENKWSLPEFIIGFFMYYNKFNFKEEGVSVRSGRVVKSRPHSGGSLYWPLFVEDPFDGTNVAKCVKTPNHMSYIQSKFKETCDFFSEKRNFDFFDFITEENSSATS